MTYKLTGRDLAIAGRFSNEWQTAKEIMEPWMYGSWGQPGGNDYQAIYKITEIANLPGDMTDGALKMLPKRIRERGIDIRYVSPSRQYRLRPNTTVVVEPNVQEKKKVDDKQILTGSLLSYLLPMAADGTEYSVSQLYGERQQAHYPGYWTNSPSGADYNNMKKLEAMGYVKQCGKNPIRYKLAGEGVKLIDTIEAHFLRRADKVRRKISEQINVALTKL